MMCNISLISTLYAQQNIDPNYFRNPLDIPITLAGNFGELRPNHFHTGLDIKTNRQENLPVYAAAEGYISRISISHTGYGNCLHIAHPNGYTTVYAHLNDFNPEITAYISALQYEKKTWAIDVNIPANTLVVTKSQQIAWSGNTGGSVAPHLHFEVRNTFTEKVINPMFWNFSYEDNIAPTIYSLAFYDDQSPYMQDPITKPVKKNESGYVLNEPIVKLPISRLRIGFDAVDKMNGSTNTLGVYKSKLYVNNALQLSITMDTIDFNTNRAINAFADYKSDKLLNTWYVQLFKLKNNPLDLYSFSNNGGYIDLADGLPREITIVLADYYGNESQLYFKVQYDPNLVRVPFRYKDAEIFKVDDINSYASHTARAIFNQQAFYDDICFVASESYNNKYLSTNLNLGNGFIPLAKSQELALKLLKPIPFVLRDKLIFQHYIPQANLPGAQSQKAMKAKFEYGYAVAPISTLGNYVVKIDTLAPKIRLLNIQKISDIRTISFVVLEESTTLKEVALYVDNQWLLCSRKGNTFLYKQDKFWPDNPQKIKIIAVDQNNNKNILETSLN